MAATGQAAQRLLRGLVLSLAVSMLAGCHSRAGAAASADLAAAPRATQVWRYLGVLACEGCAGERWDLELTDPAAPGWHDPRYSLLRTRLGRQGDAMGHQNEQGTWRRIARLGLGRPWQAYRLTPKDGTPALILLRLEDGRLMPRAQWRADVHADHAAPLQRVAAPRQSDAVDVIAPDAPVPLSLRSGQLLRVHLPESAAIGYHWEPQPDLPDSLRLEAEPARTPRSSDPGDVARTWSFRVLHADRTHLRFDYRRDWDGTAQARDAVDYDLHIQ